MSQRDTTSFFQQKGTTFRDITSDKLSAYIPSNCHLLLKAIFNFKKKAYNVIYCDKSTKISAQLLLTLNFLSKMHNDNKKAT